MRIQPRQQLLELWRATAGYSVRDGERRPSGRFVENSISDAEQLLCLMYPAAEIRWLKLDQPDKTAADVLDALSQMGDAVDIPKVLVRAVAAYMDRYETKSGWPTFAGGSRFQPRDAGETLAPDRSILQASGPPGSQAGSCFARPSSPSSGRRR